MIKIKNLLFYFIIIFIFHNHSHGLENKILLKIDNEVITSIDIENEYRYLLALNPNINNLNQNQIFEISKRSAIKEKVKKIEISKNIKDQNIQLDYLEQILKNVYQRIGIQNLEEFKKYLKVNNIEYTNVVEKIKTEALWNELIYAKFSSRIKIDQNEIKKKLINAKKKFSKSYLMSEIFFEISNTDQLTKKFSEIKKTIKEKGFDNAALTHSVSSTSNIGGKLGWINEESLNENLRKILSNLSINEFTDPVTVPGGFLILKINEIKKIENNQNVNEELKKIVKSKKNNQLNQFSKMYFNKVKKNIQINEL
jgi:peptidyl-prolyl cis-trans isomerase SurA